jgi:dCMP deaminase
MQLALITAQRTTCKRRAVGAVLLNARGHVLATGYNGVAAGQPHCNERAQSPIYHDDPRVADLGDYWQVSGSQSVIKYAAKLYTGGARQCVGFDDHYPHACAGAEAPSGQSLDACQAIHAEQNALLQCPDIHAISACYVTASPCMTCTKLLLNTSCVRIVYLDEYPHSAARELWESAGRLWVQHAPEKLWVRDWSQP